MLFFCSKKSQIKFYTLSNSEDHNKRELQNNTTNHSADIDYKDFIKTYKEWKNESYSFLTMDTTLSADIFFNIYNKSFRFIIKMTLTDELKVLDDKIKANQAQYNSDREAAKISALSFKELDKSEYLTVEDLGYKPANDKYNANKLASEKLRFLKKLSLEAKERLDKTKEVHKKIDYKKLVCVHKNGKIVDFNIFRRLGYFIRNIYFDDISLKQWINKMKWKTYLETWKFTNQEIPAK